MNFELLTTTTFIISTCLSHNTRIQRRIRQNPSQIRIAEIRKNRRPLGQKHEIIRPIPKAMTHGALQHRLPLILSPPLFFSASILYVSLRFGDKKQRSLYFEG